MKPAALQAAVYHEHDPRAALSPRAIPDGADVHRIGNCTLGYSHTPALSGGAESPRQRFTLLEMAGRGHRKALRSLVRARRENGVVIEDLTAWATVAADIAGAIFGPGMTRLNVEGQLAFMDLDIDGATLAPIAARAAQWRRAPEYKPLTGEQIGRLVQLDWQERDALAIHQIIAWNESTPERRKRRDRERRAAERAARTAADKITPWDRLGISRATYYRRRETKNVGVSTIEGNADKNRLTPGNADGFCLNLRPEMPSTSNPMGNADKNRLTSRKGASK